MTKPIKRLLFWSPRILCMLLAVFLSIFALDVFSEGYGVWKTILALLLHLIPTWIVLVVLIISWRWELVGAVLFNGLGLFYLLTTLNHLSWILPISGPLFLVGILFLLNWFYRRELRTKT